MDPVLALRGFILGLTIAAAVGPISLLVIRRTVAEGRRYGFVSGLGVATADRQGGAEWSGRRDSNPRSRAPKARALPGYATPRRFLIANPMTTSLQRSVGTVSPRIIAPWLERSTGRASAIPGQRHQRPRGHSPRRRSRSPLLRPHTAHPSAASLHASARRSAGHFGAHPCVASCPCPAGRRRALHDGSRAGARRDAAAEPAACSSI